MKKIYREIRVEKALEMNGKQKINVNLECLKESSIYENNQNIFFSPFLYDFDNKIFMTES